MSYLLPQLTTPFAVDQAILHELKRVVCIRFGIEHHNDCIIVDEVLGKIAEKVKNMCVIYCVNIENVPDFNALYELYDPVSIMFFHRNKHILVDLGTGNNNKIDWPLDNKDDLIDIIETVYRGANKGKGLVVPPKDFSFA